MTGLLAAAGVLAAAWLGWPGVAIALALAVLVFAIAGSRRDASPAVVLVAALSSLMAFRSVPPPDIAAPEWVSEAEAVRGVIVTAPSRGSGFDSFGLEVSGVEVNDRWEVATGRLCVVGPQSPVARLGDSVWIPGDPVSIDDEPERFRGVMNARGCGATLFARSLAVDESGSGWQRSMAEARDRFSATIRALAPGDSGALMSGLVTGADDALSRERKDAFLETGTTHITAVSGSNFATLVTVLIGAGSVAGWHRNRVWLALVVVAIWGYAVFVSMEAPAVRAALTATGAIAAVRIGRRPDVVTLVALAGASMALASPGIVWGLGFQLSLAASLALSATARFGAGTPIGAAIGSALVATMTAQIATLPLLLPLRGELPLSSLPANLAIGPLVALAFPLSAISGIAAATWRPLGSAFAIPGELAANGIISIVDWFAGAGGAVPVGRVGVDVGAILTVAAALACISLTAEGQRTWRQWPDRFARLDLTRRALLAGAVFGGVVAAALLIAGFR